MNRDADSPAGEVGLQSLVGLPFCSARDPLLPHLSDSLAGSARLAVEMPMQTQDRAEGAAAETLQCVVDAGLGAGTGEALDWQSRPFMQALVMRTAPSPRADCECDRTASVSQTLAANSLPVACEPIAGCLSFGRRSPHTYAHSLTLFTHTSSYYTRE